MMDISKGNTIIFSVDMNNGFAREGPLYSKRVEALIAPTAAFLAEARNAGIPVIAFTDAHQDDSLEFGGYPPHCLDGTAESEIVDELKPYIDRIIKKNSTNCFFVYDGPYEPDHNYIITGCCTDICIYQFAVTLRAYLNQHDIRARVIVPRDLTDTYDAPGHDALILNDVFFKSMADNGIEVPAKLL